MIEKFKGIPAIIASISVIVALLVDYLIKMEFNFEYSFNYMLFSICTLAAIMSISGIFIALVGKIRDSSHPFIR